MKYLSCSFAFLISCLFLTVKGETVFGPAKMFSDSDKQPLILIYDSVDVSCSQLKDGWYKIRLSIKLTEAAYKSKVAVKMGEKIRDMKGNIIGMALTDIPSNESWPWHGTYGMYLNGIIEKQYIRTNSIPENLLIDIINANRSNLTFPAFKDLITSFMFQTDDLLKKNYPNLKEYTLSDDWPSPIDPLDRIQFIFENDTLIGIVHSRPISLSNAEDYDLDTREKLLLFRAPANTTKKDFIKVNKDIFQSAN